MRCIPDNIMPMNDGRPCTLERTSKATANSRTKPLMTWMKFESTLRLARPRLSTPITRPSTIEPATVPIPPANLDIFAREGLVERVRTQGPVFKRTLERLYDIPIAGDVRGAGYFLGTELTRDQQTRVQ